MTNKSTPKEQETTETVVAQSFFSPEVGVVEAVSVEEAGTKVNEIKGKQE